MSIRSVLISIAALTSLAACTDRTIMTCPSAQLHRTDGILYDTTADWLTEQQRFSSGDPIGALGDALKDVHQNFPEAKDQEVFDYLVSAYCPVVISTTTGKVEQRRELDAFKQALRNLMHM